MKSLVSLLIVAVFAQLSLTSANAFGARKCESKGTYKPPRGVFKMSSCRIKTEWEERYHCLPCGNKVPYQVKVVTYRDRYSNGVQRTWKCVVERSEASYSK